MSKRDRQRQMADAGRQASEAGRTLQAQRTFEKPAETEPAPENTGGEDGGARFKPRNDERDNAMAEVVARHERENFAEASEPAPAPEPRRAAAPESEPAPEPSAPATPAAPDDPSQEPAPEPVKTIRVKVDGEEFDAPEADVEEAGGIAQYRMYKASENRLKKANDAMAEAKRMQAQIAESVQQFAAAVPKAPVEPVKSPAEVIKESLAQIRFGTDDDAAAALQKVLDSVAQKAPDEATLTASIMSRVGQENGKEVFVKEFSDIVTNQILLSTAITLENAALANAKKNGQAIQDWSVFYRSIGNQVRSAFGRSSQSAPAPAVTTGTPSQATSEKEARKASITQIPTAAARATPAEPDDKPESREQTLAKMQAWRATGRST